jgi:uncharacterized protein (TIGR00369 family)
MSEDDFAAGVDAQTLKRANASAPFNRWAGFTLEDLAPNRCALGLHWRPEFAQYSGLLHAGVAASLLETSCGFAASTVLGPVLVSQMSVSYLASASGERFRAEAALLRGGRRQAFAEARLYVSGEEKKLVAIASVVLLRTTREASQLTPATLNLRA